MAINLLEMITPLQCFSQLYSSVMQAYVFWSLFCQGTLKHVVEVNIVQSETIFAYSGADCTASCWCENTIGTVQQAKLHYKVLHRDMHFAGLLKLCIQNLIHVLVVPSIYVLHIGFNFLCIWYEIHHSLLIAFFPMRGLANRLSSLIVL